MGEKPAGAPIIFYDGECGFCNKSVQFVMKHDTGRVFYFAPLQGETADRAHLVPEGDPSEWSMILVDEKGIHDKSTAALRVASKLNGFWSLLGLFLIVPKKLRDGVYDFIAKHRNRSSAEADSCPIPSLEERERILP